MHVEVYRELRPRPYYSPVLERLMCRAASDEAFAARLLAAPDQALGDYSLSDQEYALVASITTACDIHDFAAQLHGKLRRRHTCYTLHTIDDNQTGHTILS